MKDKLIIKLFEIILHYLCKRHDNFEKLENKYYWDMDYGKCRKGGW